jgi:hypothetical protein
VISYVYVLLFAYIFVVAAKSLTPTLCMYRRHFDIVVTQFEEMATRAQELLHQGDDQEALALFKQLQIAIGKTLAWLVLLYFDIDASHIES